MKADRAALATASRRLDPVIRLVLFHGQDTTASTDLADSLSRQFARSDPMGPTVIAGATLAADPGALLAAASEVSMFGGTTLVRVDNAGEDALAAVSQLLDAPISGNPVVMTAGILRKGSKLLARVEAASNALTYVSYPLDARGAAAVVGEIAGEAGLQPSRAAVQILFDMSAGDRGVLRREIEKLALYLDATPSAPVTLEPEAVVAVGADLGETDFTALVESIAGGRPDLTDRQLARFRTAGIPGMTLLRTVARRFWLLLDLRLAVDSGLSASSAVDGARPPVFWKEKASVTAQLGRWQTSTLQGVLARLLAAERGIKSPFSPGEIGVNQLLLAIATQAARR